MRYWLFQAVPERYKLAYGIRNQTEENWLVTRYARQIQKGDIVYFWQAGKLAGILGWGTILSEDASADENGDDRMRVSYDQYLKNSIPKESLKKHPALRSLHVLRSPQGTNFAVTPEEALELNRLIAKQGVPVPPDPDEHEGGDCQ
jgi:predicted RNA-binding protein with PUA-like domain